MLNPQVIAAFLGRAVQAAWIDHALAYIGPGAGLGGIAIAVALFVGALFLVVGLVWYPLKRMVNGRGEGAASRSRTDESE